MTLEEQLATLAKLGLKLEDGVTVDEVLEQFDRESFEDPPFDLVLLVLGAEVERPTGWQPICRRAWDFDTECIYESDDYVRIVKRLCELTGEPDRLAQISGSIDFAAGRAWLKYTVNGAERSWSVTVDRDWADMLTLSYVMADLQRGDGRFHAKDNGQAMVLFYLDPPTAAELNRLSNNALGLAVPQV